MKKLYKLLLICLLIIAGGGNALKAQSYNSDNSETANRAETPTYISKIAVAYGAEASKPKDILKDNGFTVIDYDLNKGCGATSHYIYMGYKTTTNPADAITGIFFRTGENPPNSATFDGVTAYLLGGSDETNPGENTYVDLNAKASGQYIYTYVTRNTSRAAVINGMYFDGSSSASGYVTPNVNLNSGTKGGAIYLHYQQFSGKASATFHYLNANGSRTSSSTSVSVKHHQQAVNNTPSAPSSISYDGRTFALIGWREDNTATTAGSTPSYTYMDSKVYRAVYSANVSLIYNANGGSGAPSTQNATQYINAGSSSIAISNASITIPATIPTHDATKCNFSGWSTSSSATTAQYQPGNNISINTNTTLYAVWPEHNGTKKYINIGETHTYIWSCCGKSMTEDHIYDDGIDCDLCDGYPATLVDGYYQINNANELLWFAEYVNYIDKTASAKLMNDIDLENRPWTPIGTTGESSHNFRGHFDGNGKTITGLNVEVTRSGGGFFGEVRLGTVEDFTIYGEVKLNGKYDYVGGVIGSAPGFNSNQPDHNGATIRNITSYVNVTLGEGSHGSNRVAGFIGYANHETLIENCTWYGTLDLGPYRAQDGVGGLVGKANDNSEITIRNCAAYGTIKTSYQSGSYNSHNSIYIGGIVSNSVASAQTTLENCIWAGTLINNTNLDDNAHISAIGTLNGSKSVSNCYALDNMPYITTNNAHNTGITEVTAGQLASGEIAYKLQGTQATQIWGQNIDNEETANAKPILGGAKVYEHTFDGTTLYSNSQTLTAGGKCGDNLYWYVNNENVLIIFGTGNMYDYDYSYSQRAPWLLTTAPTSLVLEEGMTSIGNYAFYSCSGFTGSLTIPNSVTYIGNSAFYNCNGFNGSLTIPNNVTYIGNYAFSSCSGFTGSLTIPNSVTTIGYSAFLGCNGFTGSLTIPNSVTTIEMEAFSRCSGFTGSLTIPNSVTTIGEWAFSECSGFTGSLTIPNSVTSIGECTFSGCSGFTGSLTIPNSVTYIGNEAFKQCNGFSDVCSLAETAPTLGKNAFSDINSNAILYYPTSGEQSYNDKGWFDYFSNRIGFGKCGDNLYWYVDDNNTLTIFGTGAMYDYNDSNNKAPWRNLKTVPTSLVLEEGITHIGNFAFCNCKGLSGSLTIPNSVTTIGNFAFYDCYGFTGSLTIPNSVTTIGNWAFGNCSGFKGSLTIPNSVTSIGEAAFFGCSGFTGSLTIPNSVTTIGNYAFENCSGFNGFLTIPNSVTSIGKEAFYKCSGFTGSLTIPNSVTSIGNWAFGNCSGFKGSLAIGNSVTTIGDNAFRQCNGFSDVYSFAVTAPTLGTDAFDKPNNATLYYPASSEQSYDDNGWFEYFPQHIGFNNKCGDNLYWIVNDNTLTIFGTGAMDDYESSGDNISPWRKLETAPTSLLLEEGITHIGNNAFAYCSGLTGSLTIPNSVTTIGNEAFYYCFGFTGDLTIPNSVTTIEEWAFGNCSGFTGDLTIPNSVTTIGNYAFYYCFGFTGDLTIPNSVTSIGNYAFYYCYGFTGDLTIPNSVTTIGDSAFAYCSGFNGELTIPNSVTSIGNWVFASCEGFNGELTIPNSVTTIGNYAFYNCSGFNGDLTIPNSVTSIGNSAFYYCYGLTNIFFYRDTNPTIYSYTFSNLNSNAKIYAPVIWESFTGIPSDKLVKMATFVGQQTTDNGQQSSSTGWVGLAEGQTEPNENDHVAVNAPLVLGRQQDNKTTRQQGSEANSLSVKSFGQCGDGTTVNGSITIEDGGELYCEAARGEVTVKKDIIGYAETTRLQDNETTSETVWYTIASPLKDTLLISDPQFLSSNSDLYRYDEPTYTWQNAKPGEGSTNFQTIDPGRGYLYANAENTTLEFTGMINTDEVTYSLTTDGIILKGFHLVGNPFTHNITFAHLNATEGAELVNGYYILNGEGAWGATLGSNDDDVIKPVQGVLVKAKSAGTLAIAKTQRRRDAESQSRGQQDNRTTRQQVLEMSVSNAQHSDRAFVVFDKGVGLDKINHENENIPLLYIPMDDTDYAIAMMDMNVNEIPVSFETKVMGQYTISLRQDNCEFDELYLLDKQTGEKVNILENDYTFIATSNDAPERFVLLKDNGQQTTDNSHFAYVNNGDIVIYDINGNADIKIFDAMGRCLYMGNSSDETARIANDFSAGVYVIQKADDNGVNVQKIIL